MVARTLPLDWTVPVTVTLFPVLRSLQALWVKAVALVVVTVFELTVNETDGHVPDNADKVPLICVGAGAGGGGVGVGVGGGGVGAGGGAAPAAACEMTNDWSAAVMRAERAPPLFAATLMAIVLVAVPLPPDVTETDTHGTSTPVVHEHPARVTS
jgi:hypothetical protein